MNPLHICFKVRPTPSHPAYWLVQFGHLHVFLFDADILMAKRRALAIVAQLPFEVVGPNVFDFRFFELTEAEQVEAVVQQPWLLSCLARAKIHGFDFLFEGWEIGTDEKLFNESFLPGVNSE